MNLLIVSSNEISSSQLNRKGYSLEYYPAQQVAISVLLCIATIVGIFGNILIVVAVGRFRKLWTPTNKFIASLAISNLLTSITLPYHIWTILSRGGEGGGPMGKAGCVAIAAMVITGQVVSMFTIALIAVCRAMLVRGKPRFYDRIYTNVNICVMIAVSWLLPMLVIIVSSLANFAKLGYNNKYKACLVVSGQSGVSSLLAGVIVGVPSIITVVINYGYVFLHLRRYHISIKWKFQGANRNVNDSNATSGEPERPPGTELETIDEEQRGTSTEQISGDTSNMDTHSVATIPAMPRDNNSKVVRKAKSSAERSITNRQHKLTRNLFIIVCVFALCVMPFCVAIIIPGARAITLWLAILFLSNNAVNPVLYGFLHEPLQKAVLQLYKDLKKKLSRQRV